MTEQDVENMSDGDIQRHLAHLRGIKAFWDEADRAEVQRMIALLERAAASRISAPSP